MSTELQIKETAEELFRAAYENRYTWDEQFPGIAADFTLKLSGQTHTGKLEIRKDLSVSVETEEPKAQEWLTNQLRDVVTHRKRSDFASAHGKHSFTIDGDIDETGAVPILVGGDAMGSHYKVRDQQVVYVARTMGPMSFTINHLAKLDTGSGYISTAYNAVFRNARTGEITRQSKFEDNFTQLAGYWVMSSQIVQSRVGDQPEVTELTFENLRTL
ncbi:MAG: DUF3386 domain-containing protein [Anaerolineae bacterium]|nr:DUF3386 domain-containing protein [Gloeobacterales cyanobacterium ES-bin-313]